MAFPLYRRPALERRNIMLSSSWLRNWKRSAPAAARRTQTSSRRRASFRPRPEALEDRSFAQRLPANQPGRLRVRHCALHRPQPERLGHGFHAGRVFRCGQRVHHRAGHVLQPLWPRAVAEDHRAGLGERAARVSRPPHRRRVQPDEGLRDLGQRQIRPGPPDLRFDRRHHQRLEPQGRSDACDRHGGQRRRWRRLHRAGHGPEQPGAECPVRGRHFAEPRGDVQWRLQGHRLVHRSDRDEH